MENLINELRSGDYNLTKIRAANALELLQKMQQQDLVARMQAEARDGFMDLGPSLEFCIDEYRRVMNEDAA